MSNKSGTSNQIINTPSGGGAQAGMGEKFSPDLFTGTGNFSVPITVPPGRNGFQPQLSLVYSTGNGNGPFGLGWGISIPGVERKTSKGIPRYQGQDTFILSGAEDLIPVETVDHYIQYRPRTEGLFAIIRHFQNPTQNLDYWEVKSKDGLISYYGQRNIGNINQPATVFDPNLENHDHIFSWKLTETIDPFGNRIIYEYESGLVEPTDGSRSWNQIYLKSIKYIDYLDGQGIERFLAEITFEYEEDRPDPFSSYNAGFEIRTTKRCNRIVVKTSADLERTVRAYELKYTEGELNKVSLLTSIEVIGHDENATNGAPQEERLPPLQFTYTLFEPIGQNFIPIEGTDFPVLSLSDANTELIDLFGNGMPDIIQMNGVVRYWQNRGNGQFDLPRMMENAPAGLMLANPNVQFMDVNGEGKADLVVTQPGLSGYFPTKFNAEWNEDSFRMFAVTPSFNLFDPEVKLVDLNGDGVTDAIRAGSSLELYIYDPNEGWQEPRLVPRQEDLSQFPNVIFSDPRVRFADMSGDGLQDIVMIYDGNIEYWPYMGHGKWGSRIHMENSPHFPYGYDTRRILIGDIAGDGPSDIVYVDNDRITIWINQNGNGFSDPIEILGTPSVTDMDAVRLDDMLGNGISGILWTSDKGFTQRPNYFFLDLTGGVKPYLLHEMNNNMGAITKVGYKPSTYYYNLDAQHYLTRWKTSLPFPVQVVAQVEVIDDISKGKLTTEYFYHHGYWDGGEREFRGFGKVDQRDTQTFDDYNTSGLHGLTSFLSVDQDYYTYPLLTKTWFHLGPVGEEYGDWEELDYSAEYWQDDSQKLEDFSDKNAVLSAYDGMWNGRRIKRDAIRTLRGSILRTELYALDGHPERENRPYTVTENKYSFDQKYGPEENVLPYGMSRYIFFPRLVASRTTQWERGEYPMTQFSFTNNYDEFGQPTEQWAVTCPRRWQENVDVLEGFLTTYMQTEFAYSETEATYIKDRVAKTTAYEVPTLESIDQLQGILMMNDPMSEMNLIGQTLTYYDGEAFQGLPFGQIGSFGAAVRSESLVMTEANLQEAFTNAPGIIEIPPYLNPNGSITWTDDYPQEFRNYIENLPGIAGYNFYEGSDEHTRGYFVTATRVEYDFHRNAGGRGLPITNRDPLGRDTSIEYHQPYHILPNAVTTPFGLTTRADYDYRVMQPTMVTDPNGNRQAFTFTPLGLVKDIAILGKADRFEGDNGQNGIVPSTVLEYDFLAYVNTGQPISVTTITRIYYIADNDAPEPERRNETIKKIEFSDGFGRLIQTRAQAEDVFFGDIHFANNANLPIDQAEPGGTAVGQIADSNITRVIVSGWQVYDNKGQVVEKYEPFFDSDWAYQAPGEEQMGEKIRMYYDPRGQVIRTLNPDGSEQRVIYGIPNALETPDNFTPTPWEAYTYDANDLAPLSTYNEMFLTNRAPVWHHFTPANIVIDALGRTIRAVERNCIEGGVVETYETKSEYDIRGNLLTVTDALNRLAFQYTYDLANRNLSVNSIDAGLKRTVLDVMGNPLESRDSKGALMLTIYDNLNRPTHLWAKDGEEQPVTLRQFLVYGETLPESEALERNARGQVISHFDEAGLTTFHEFDFKGNLLEKTRQVISDTVILEVYQHPLPNNIIQAFQLDWGDRNTISNRANTLLDSFNYTTTTHYDALNRIKRIHYPQDVDGARKILQPRYNRAGALEQVTFDSDTYVQHIAYNAKGQRTLIAYGNNTMTRYAYDLLTFRLKRMRTERYQQSSDFTFEPDIRAGQERQDFLQDFAYEYDLVGNIISIHDRTPGSGISNTLDGLDALNRAFQYDAIYRLLSASGREQDTNRPVFPWEEAPMVQDPNQTRAYTQHYEYDAMGNMLVFQHQANGASFNRTYEHEIANNRLRSMTIGNGTSNTYHYAYDATGNMTREGLSRHYEWNHSNQLKVFRNQTEGAAATIHAHYLYDAGGMRTKKLVRTQGGNVQITTFIDGLYEHHREINSGNAQENNTLHLMDDQARVALLRVGVPIDNDTTPPIKYHLGDHLGSSNVVIMGNNAANTTEVNREEYYPYGETSLGSFERKRYRYSGKEKDSESGLYYYGFRYYYSFVKIWINTDPSGPINHLNLYNFSKNNPIIYIDPLGLNSENAQDNESNVDNFQVTQSVVMEAEKVVGDKTSGVLDSVSHNNSNSNQPYRKSYSYDDWVRDRGSPRHPVEEDIKKFYSTLVRLNGVLRVADSFVTFLEKKFGLVDSKNDSGNDIEIITQTIDDLSDLAFDILGSNLRSSLGVKNIPKPPKLTSRKPGGKNSSSSKRGGVVPKLDRMKNMLKWVMQGGSLRFNPDGSVTYYMDNISVTYDLFGFPNFKDYLFRGGDNDVQIKLTGYRDLDEIAANKEAGFDETPEGYTWHHHQEKGRMQLVLTKIHDMFPHRGGFSLHR